MARSRAAATASVPRWPLLVVVAGVAAGLALTVVGEASWRAGCLVIGGSLEAGALIRAVLADRAAGLLAVRSRRLDVAVLALLGAAILALALTVPPGR